MNLSVFLNTILHILKYVTFSLLGGDTNVGICYLRYNLAVHWVKVTVRDSYLALLVNCVRMAFIVEFWAHTFGKSLRSVTANGITSETWYTILVCIYLQLRLIFINFIKVELF